jgi:hypothetical protein
VAQVRVSKSIEPITHDIDIQFNLCQLLRHCSVRLALVQRALVPPAALVERKGRTREHEEQKQVVERQRLGLEDRSHERDINEPKVRQERDRHGDDEHPVQGKPQPSPRFWIAETRSRKTKQEKVCESEHTLRGEKSTHHRLVAARYALVVRQRIVVYKERSEDDDGRGKEEASSDAAADDRLVLLPRRPAHHVVVDGVDAERLARRACAKCRFGTKVRLKAGLVREHSPSMRMLMNRICVTLSGLLSPNIVLSVMSVSAAAAALSWKDWMFWMLWNIDFPATEVSTMGQGDGRIRRTRQPAGWC